MEEILQDFIQIFDAVSGVSQDVLARKPTINFTGAEETAKPRVPSLAYWLQKSVLRKHLFLGNWQL
jgi:hypothetical protein